MLKSEGWPYSPAATNWAGPRVSKDRKRESSYEERRSLFGRNDVVDKHSPEVRIYLG